MDIRSYKRKLALQGYKEKLKTQREVAKSVADKYKYIAQREKLRQALREKRKKEWSKKRLGSAAFDRAIANRRRIKFNKLTQEESEARGIMGKTDYFD